MMNATEARAKLMNLKEQDENERMAKITNFVETTCAQRIEEAIENRHYSVTVSVPDKMSAGDTAIELRKYGYAVSVTYGSTDKLNISW